MTKQITVEDIINVWLCIQSHMEKIKESDEKAYEDIMKTYIKLIKIPLEEFQC